MRRSRRTLNCSISMCRGPGRDSELCPGRVRYAAALNRASAICRKRSQLSIPRSKPASAMTAKQLRLPQLDSRRDDFRAALTQLRDKLSPRGDIVSEAGKQRTIEVFGAPLAPAQVVERICRDVRDKGLAAVLDYSAKIDKATLSADTIRVPAADLEAAHRNAAPEFLHAIERVRAISPNFKPRSCTMTRRSSEPTAFNCGSAICRSIGLAFVFPAVRRRILPQC